MPYRRTVFTNNEIYHTLNRGITKESIFLDKKDYQRFLELIEFYKFNPPLRFSYYNRLSAKEKQNFITDLKKNNKPIINILGFCLMPNHFHLLLKQLQDKGIEVFMRNFQNSYAKYFNTKYHRAGPIFQLPFKAIRMETDEQLIHVSRYIHLNPSTSSLVKIKDLENYPWSSLIDYLSPGKFKFVDTKIIFNYFNLTEKYKKFVFDNADYQRELNNIKHLILEN